MCPKVEKLMLLSHLVIFCEVLGDQCGLQGANVTLNAEYIQASGSFDSVLWARQDASGNFGDSVVFFQPPNNHVYDNRYSADKVQVVNQANNPALIIQNFGESDLDVYEARVSHDGTFRIESDLSEMVKTSDIHVISVTACGRNFNETEIRESLMCSTGDVIFSVSMIDDYNCSFEIAFKRGSDEICKEEHGNGCTPGNCNYDCTISSEGDVDITVTLDFTPSDPYEKSFQFEIEGSPTTSSASTTTDSDESATVPSITGQTTTPSPGPLSIWQIVIIAIACVVCVILIIIGVIMLIRYCNQHDQKRPSPNSQKTNQVQMNPQQPPASYPPPTNNPESTPAVVTFKPPHY